MVDASPERVDERCPNVDDRHPSVDDRPASADARDNHMLRSDHPPHHYMLWFWGLTTPPPGRIVGGSP